MSDTKFTPGPWSYRDCPVHAGAETSPKDAGRIKLVDYNDGKFTGVLAIVQTEQSEANARLIAAAPELYDALESIVLDGGVVGSGEMEDAKSALKKARGDYG